MCYRLFALVLLLAPADAIAQAPPKVQVPDVTGQTKQNATNTLRNAGFNVVSQTQDTSNKSQDGKVISINPPAGSSQTKGSTVTIVIGHFKATTSTSSSTTTNPTSSNTTTTTTK